MVTAPVRPGDRASATILAFEAELTAAGLLPPGDVTAPRRGRPPVQPHGTRAGYQRHRRAGEQPCDRCLIAARDESRARKAAALADPERATVIRESGRRRLAAWRGRQKGAAA